MFFEPSNLPRRHHWGVLLMMGVLAAPVVSDVLIPEAVGHEFLIDLASLSALAVSCGIGAFLLRRWRLADAALARSDTQLRTLIETAFDAVMVGDDAGRIVSMNKAAETMFGYTADEVVGRHYAMLTTEEGLQAHKAHLARSQAGSAGQATLGQAEGRRRNGETFPLELSLASWSAGGRALFTGIMRDVSESRAAESRLRRSEAVHRSIVDSAGEAVIVIDQAATITLFNPAAEAMFGYAADEVVGGSLERLMPEKAARAHAAYLAEHGVTALVLSGQQSTHKGRRKTGETFTFAMNMTEWSDDGVRMFTGLIRDMTVSLAAEAALRRSEAQNRAVIDTAGDGIILFDGEGRILSYNRAAQDMFGYTPEEAVGRRVGLLMTEEQRREKRYIARYAPGAEPAVFPLQKVERRRKNGETFPCELSVTEWRDGERSFYTAVMRDVTERERAEAALRDSETFAHSILNSSSDCIKVLDPDGRLLYVNEPGLKLLEIDALDAIRGARWAEFWPRDATRRVRAAMRDALRGRRAHLIASRPSATGQLKWWDVVITPIPGADGAPARLLAISRDITEAKAAEAELQQSRADFERLFQNAPDALSVLRVCPSGRFVYEQLNPACEELMARFGGNPLGLAPEDMFPPSISALANDRYRRCVQTAAVISTSDAFDFEGERFTCEATVVPITDAEGSVTRLLVSLRDVTERVRAETALRESEDRYSRIFAHSLAMITLFDVSSTGEFSYNAINPAAERLTGMRNDDLVGRTPEEVLPPKVAERTMATLRKCLAAGEPVELEGVLRTPDGSPAMLMHQLVPIRDGEGRITQLLAKSRDVTDSKRAAEVLRESQARFEHLFEHSADALFVTLIGPDQDIVYERVNKAAEALLGMSKEVEGRRLAEVLPPEIAAMTRAGYLECVRQAKVLTFEDQIRMPDGLRTFQSQLVPIPDADGRVVRILASSREITERLVAEERLRSSQKLEAIGQLAGGVAHDFNNLLLVVDGYARRALRLVDNGGEAFDALAEVLAATNRGSELIKQLLVFSRRQVNDPRPVLVGEALRDTERLLRPLLGANYQLQIRPAADAEALCAEIDPAEFGQCVLNLALNARDAMPDGGAIGISLRRGETAETGTGPSCLVVEVQDHGCGMDAAVMNRVFEPFFTTKEQGKGTGLGLAMVYGFAQQSGGAISVSSTPGAGSTFSLRLPISERTPVVDLAEIEVHALGQGETVLLVEDDVQLLGLLRQTVEELGYRVITAQNGLEALEVEAEHDGVIDLVLTDVIMPSLGGFELAEILRESRPDAAVLFMSGYPARGESQVLAIPNGAAFLPKPFTPAKLAAAIRSALSDDPETLSVAEAA